MKRAWRQKASILHPLLFANQSMEKIHYRENAPLLKDDFRLALQDELLYEVGVEELIHYHGGHSVCGVCLLWSLVRQFCRLSDTKVLPRRSVELVMGADGKGIRDGVEFLFRAFEEGRAHFDPHFGESLNAPVAPSNAGSFVFRLSLPETKGFTFVLKEKFVPVEYFRLCEKKNAAPRSFGEEAERKRLQLDFARLMLLEEQAFDLL